MITADWVRLMARHNAWQHEWVIPAITGLDDATLRADRGLFFGSILATANHILWADQAWLQRLGVGTDPAVPPERNTELAPDGASWAVDRRDTDAAITAWADGLTQADCDGDLTWFAGLSGVQMTKPRAVVLSHMFLHQIHHRGQIHAAFTGLGVATQPTDLPVMEYLA